MEIVQLTADQRKEYVESGGANCPYCDCGVMDCLNLNIEGGKVFQKVGCTDCGRIWYDIYKLENIEEVQ